MSNQRQYARLAINYVLPVLVAGFIGWYFWEKLRDPRLWERGFSFRPEWLFLSGILYLCAHTIWASYWVTLLHNQKVKVSWSRGVRAYFISQLGKYVPGKVWVIVIRVAMMGSQGVGKPVVAVTATFEALTAMAAGAFLASILLPLLTLDPAGLGAKIYLLIPLALMPLGLRGLNRLLAYMAKKRQPPGSDPWPWIGMLVLLRGVVQDCIGWAILGLSLWLTIQGISPTPIPFSWELIGRLIAYNCLAYVAGFIFLFMPAGAGVREAFIQLLLAIELRETLGDEAGGIAAVIALVLRLLWTLFELVLAGILYWCVPAAERHLRLSPENEVTV